MQRHDLVACTLAALLSLAILLPAPAHALAPPSSLEIDHKLPKALERTRASVVQMSTKLFERFFPSVPEVNYRERVRLAAANIARSLFMQHRVRLWGYLVTPLPGTAELLIPLQVGNKLYVLRSGNPATTAIRYRTVQMLADEHPTIAAIVQETGWGAGATQSEDRLFEPPARTNAPRGMDEAIWPMVEERLWILDPQGAALDLFHALHNGSYEVRGRSERWSRERFRSWGQTLTTIRAMFDAGIDAASATHISKNPHAVSAFVSLLNAGVALPDHTTDFLLHGRMRDSLRMKQAVEGLLNALKNGLPARSAFLIAASDAPDVHARMHHALMEALVGNETLAYDIHRVLPAHVGKEPRDWHRFLEVLRDPAGPLSANNTRTPAGRMQLALELYAESFPELAAPFLRHTRVKSMAREVLLAVHGVEIRTALLIAGHAVAGKEPRETFSQRIGYLYLRMLDTTKTLNLSEETANRLADTIPVAQLLSPRMRRAMQLIFTQLGEDQARKALRHPAVYSLAPAIARAVQEGRSGPYTLNNMLRANHASWQVRPRGAVGSKWEQARHAREAEKHILMREGHEERLRTIREYGYLDEEGFELEAGHAISMVQTHLDRGDLDEESAGTFLEEIKNAVAHRKNLWKEELLAFSRDTTEPRMHAASGVAQIRDAIHAHKAKLDLYLWHHAISPEQRDQMWEDIRSIAFRRVQTLAATAFEGIYEGIPLAWENPAEEHQKAAVRFHRASQQWAEPLADFSRGGVRGRDVLADIGAYQRARAPMRWPELLLELQELGAGAGNGRDTDRLLSLKAELDSTWRHLQEGGIVDVPADFSLQAHPGYLALNTLLQGTAGTQAWTQRGLWDNIANALAVHSAAEVWDQVKIDMVLRVMHALQDARAADLPEAVLDFPTEDAREDFLTTVAALARGSFLARDIDPHAFFLPWAMPPGEPPVRMVARIGAPYEDRAGRRALPMPAEKAMQDYLADPDRGAYLSGATTDEQLALLDREHPAHARLILFFDDEGGFLASYRGHLTEKEFDPLLEYLLRRHGTVWAQGIPLARKTRYLPNKSKHITRYAALAKDNSLQIPGLDAQPVRLAVRFTKGYAGKSIDTHFLAAGDFRDMLEDVADKEGPKKSLTRSMQQTPPAHGVFHQPLVYARTPHGFIPSDSRPEIIQKAGTVWDAYEDADRHPIFIRGIETRGPDADKFSYLFAGNLGLRRALHRAGPVDWQLIPRRDGLEVSVTYRDQRHHENPARNLLNIPLTWLGEFNPSLPHAHGMLTRNDNDLAGGSLNTLSESEFRSLARAWEGWIVPKKAWRSAWSARGTQTPGARLAALREKYGSLEAAARVLPNGLLIFYGEDRKPRIVVETRFYSEEFKRHLATMLAEGKPFWLAGIELDRRRALSNFPGASWVRGPDGKFKGGTISYRNTPFSAGDLLALRVEPGLDGNPLFTETVSFLGLEPFLQTGRFPAGTVRLPSAKAYAMIPREGVPTRRLVDARPSRLAIEGLRGRLRGHAYAEPTLEDVQIGIDWHEQHVYLENHPAMRFPHAYFGVLNGRPFSKRIGLRLNAKTLVQEGHWAMEGNTLWLDLPEDKRRAATLRVSTTSAHAKRSKPRERRVKIREGKKTTHGGPYQYVYFFDDTGTALAYYRRDAGTLAEETFDAMLEVLLRVHGTVWVEGFPVSPEGRMGFASAHLERGFHLGGQVALPLRKEGYLAMRVTRGFRHRSLATHFLHLQDFETLLKQAKREDRPLTENLQSGNHGPKSGLYVARLAYVEHNPGLEPVGVLSDATEEKPPPEILARAEGRPLLLGRKASAPIGAQDLGLDSGGPLDFSL